MTKLRVSGALPQHKESLSKLSAAFYEVGDVFSEGISLCVDSSTWPSLLLCLSRSPWKGRVAHESKTWIAIGGSPEDILLALEQWGFKKQPFRRWHTTHVGTDRFLTVQLGALGASAIVRVQALNVSPTLTAAGTLQLLAAAGVRSSSVQFTGGNADIGRALHLEMCKTDADKLCARPIVWNGQIALRLSKAPGSSNASTSLGDGSKQDARKEQTQLSSPAGRPSTKASVGHKSSDLRSRSTPPRGRHDSVQATSPQRAKTHSHDITNLEAA